MSWPKLPGAASAPAPAPAPAVSSVAGKIGAVTLAPSDITGFNAAASAAAPVQTSAITALAPLASPTFIGTPAAPTPTSTDNSTRLATTAMVQAALAASTAGLLDLKTSLDASASPNYPAALKGDTYIVIVAGKVGGASGKPVDVGDILVASADNAGGTEASVGTSWFAMEHNLVGAMLAANNGSDIGNAATFRANLGLGTASGYDIGTTAGTIPTLGASGSFTVPGQLTVQASAVTKDSAGQSLFASGGGVSYFYTGTSGLKINNADNSATLITVSNVGAMSVGGAISSGSSVSGTDLNVAGSTAPMLNYGGTAGLTRRGTGILSLGNGTRDDASGTLLLGTLTASGAVSGSNLSGTNTGDTVGIYATLAALQIAKPAASTAVGLHASVGTAAPYADYVNSGTAWAAVSFSSGPLATAFAGHVATNCGIPTYSDSGGSAHMAMNTHEATDTITAIGFQLANSWINPSGSPNFQEVGSGQTLTFAAWVEYPRGTYTQLTWAGGLTGGCASGARLSSDLTALPLRIPRGAKFRSWIRVIGAGTGRVFASAAGNTGDGMIFSGITSSSLPGQKIADLGSVYRPTAIFAATTVRSFLIIHDSRGYVGDSRSNGRGDMGEIAKGLAAYGKFAAGVSVWGSSGFSMAALAGQNTAMRANLVASAAYFTDIVIQLGINDINGGDSLATVQGKYATTKGYFPSTMGFWLSTCPPVTTGAWTLADLSDQTVTSGNAVRVTSNNWKRGFPAGYNGFFEVADAVESARDSGKWKATGAAATAYTGDGTHGTQIAYDAIQNSGGVDPSGVM